MDVNHSIDSCHRHTFKGSTTVIKDGKLRTARPREPFLARISIGKVTPSIDINVLEMSKMGGDKDAGQVLKIHHFSDYDP